MIGRHPAVPADEAVVAVSLPPAVPAATRVVIRYAAASDAGRQAALALAEALSGAGYGAIEIRSDAEPTSGDRIRYFEDQERAGAAALARLAGDTLSRSGRGTPQLQDSTGAAPKPPPGTLEIELGAG
jgi:hypothetical protein